MIYIKNKKIEAIYEHPNFRRILAIGNKIVFKEAIQKKITTTVFYPKIGRTNNRSIGYDINFRKGKSLRLFVSNTINFVGARYTKTGRNSGRVITCLSKDPPTPITLNLTFSKESISYLNDPIFTIDDNKLKAINPTNGSVLTEYTLSAGNFVAVAGGEGKELHAIVATTGNICTLYKIVISQGVANAVMTLTSVLAKNSSVVETYSNLFYEKGMLYSITRNRLLHDQTSQSIFKIFSIDPATGARIDKGVVTGIPSQPEEFISDCDLDRNKVYLLISSKVYKFTLIQNSLVHTATAFTHFIDPNPTPDGDALIYTNLVIVGDDILSFDLGGYLYFLNVEDIANGRIAPASTTPRISNLKSLTKIRPFTRNYTFPGITNKCKSTFFPVEDRADLLNIFTDGTVLEISKN